MKEYVTVLCILLTTLPSVEVALFCTVVRCPCVVVCVWVKWVVKIVVVSMSTVKELPYYIVYVKLNLKIFKKQSIRESLKGHLTNIYINHTPWRTRNKTDAKEVSR